MRPIYDYSILYHLGVIESAFPRNKGVKKALNMIKDVINDAPTVSPEDVRGFGNWITHHDRIVCSKCHKEFKDEVCCCDIYGWFWNFCPYCGVKMKEEQD